MSEEKIYHILVINPGSTSTKVAYYENETKIEERNLDIDRAVIKGMKSIFDQLPLRTEMIEQFLADIAVPKESLDYIVSRGGGGGNLMSGGYIINDDLVQHCYDYETPHASSLGPVIARNMADELNIPAWIYDGEGVNEFIDLAMLTGLKEFPIAPGSHTLNAKAAARIGAAKLGGKLEDFNIIVNHLGGGSSTSAHRKGKLIDSNSDAYSAERAGGMPFMGMIGFIKGLFSGKYTENQVLRMFMGGGGLMSYLGTSDLRDVLKRIDEGDKEAKYYFDGMIYQQCKDIGAMATVLNMDVDAIVLTGGMAYSKLLVDEITKRVGKIAPVIVAAGSHEMDSLVQGSLRVMRKEEKYHFYGKGEEADKFFE